MIRIATSIVGKLWVTILLLVSFVLFIFTVFMLEFLEKYHNEQSEESLRQSAAAIASIVDDEALDERKNAKIVVKTMAMAAAINTIFVVCLLASWTASGFLYINTAPCNAPSLFSGKPSTMYEFLRFASLLEGSTSSFTIGSVDS